MTEQDLLFDTTPEEDLESLDGVSRVEELENILGEIIDLWDEQMLIVNGAEKSTDYVFNLFDRAGAILAQEDYE